MVILSEKKVRVILNPDGHEDQKKGYPDYDGILSTPQVSSVSDIIGDWGPYHKNVLFIYTLVYFVAAFHNFGVTFYSDQTDHWCKRPEGYENATKQICRSYEDPNSKCRKWEYDHSFYRSTTISEVGYLISSVLFGYISDRHGRRFAFRMAIGLELMSSLSQTLSLNIWHFLMSRVLIGIASYARFLTGMLIILELSGPKIRAKINIITGIGWCGGYLMLPMVYYFIKHFRYMQLIVFSYELSLVWLLWKHIPESPSQLLLFGKNDAAEEVLIKACSVNQTGTATHVKYKLELLKKHLMIESNETKKTILDLWGSRVLLKYSLLLYFIWFTMAFVSYGFMYNASEMGGSIYLTTLGFASLETINKIFMYFIIDHYDRKTLYYFFTFSGSLAIFAMIPFSFAPWGTLYRIVFALIGTFLFTGSFTMVYLQTAEVFPTGFRQIGVGSCSVAARIGSILAPFIKELNSLTHFTLSITIFGLLGLVAGLLMFFLPETKHKNIPNTIKDAESN